MKNKTGRKIQLWKKKRVLTISSQAVHYGTAPPTRPLDSNQLVARCSLARVESYQWRALLGRGRQLRHLAALRLPGQPNQRVCHPTHEARGHTGTVLSPKLAVLVFGVAISYLTIPYHTTLCRGTNTMKNSRRSGCGMPVAGAEAGVAHTWTRTEQCVRHTRTTHHVQFRLASRALATRWQAW